MNKQLVIKKWLIVFILGLAGLLLAFYQPTVVTSASGELGGKYLQVKAKSPSPERALQQAWQNAQDAGSYRFISDIDQTLVPRALPEMIGRQDTALNFTVDGAVVLPDRAYLEMRVASADLTESVAVLRDGGESFMLQDGELKPVEDVLNLTSQTNDVLGYLAAAEQVTRLESPEGHPELSRYGFVVSGPLFAEYVRQQAETNLRAEPGTPAELTLEPLPALQTLSGQGELWVNEAGLPVRQILDIVMPQVNEQYGARIHLRVNLSGYGKVEALPKAVQGADGTWRLDGSLPALTDQAAGGVSDLPAAPAMPMAAEQASQTVTDGPAIQAEPAAGGRLLPSSLSPAEIAPSSLMLFLVAVLASVLIRFYRRYPRRVYAVIVVAMISSMLLSPLLKSEVLFRFQERQAEAAEARAEALPEMLDALGIELIEDTASPAADAEPIKSVTLSSNEALQQQENDGGGLFPRCGEGEPGVDTDGDGLDDTAELCLGTDHENADSDYDSISDKEELDGFDLGGKHWDSDPLNADSNHDGIADTAEWSSELSDYGGAVNADIDGDGLPNLWDDDDDGDMVPDAQDLSPFALTDYTETLDLSTTGAVAAGGIQMIEVTIQPQDSSHLRYSTTALDWPADNQGNIQDLDNSTEDLRLTPYLLVTTNVIPDETLSAKYGVRSWVDDDGQSILMAPLQPLEESGAVHGFYAKVGYMADETGDIQWEARLVWMIQMQNDRWQSGRFKTESSLLHRYEESFRVTGLQITRSEGAEVAVFGTPDKEDDRYLFQLFL